MIKQNYPTVNRGNTSTSMIELLEKNQDEKQKKYMEYNNSWFIVLSCLAWHILGALSLCIRHFFPSCCTNQWVVDF